MSIRELPQRNGSSVMMFPPRSNSTNMLTMGCWYSNIILRHLVLPLLYFNPSLSYSLKNCTIDYRENPSADVSLDCTNRELLTVPDDLPRDAVSVKLFNNKLEKIHRDDFGDMPKLIHVSLDLNKIAHVDDGAFICLVALKKLCMRDNRLTNLTGGLFQGLSNLTMLDLRRNQIQFIHKMTFQHLTSLETVLLDSNRLQQVTSIQSILQLPHIQKLTISSNLFSSFQTKDLPPNVSSSLTMLDVSSNKLKEFSITTPIFPHLQTIDLSHISGLKWDIPDKIFLRNITQLYLSFPLMSFEKFQKILQNLNSVIHLRLNYMDAWIRKGLLSVICKVPTLRRLDLYYNHLTKSIAELVTCSQLTELDLSITHIKELPKGTIYSMKQLTYLTLDTNMLTNVPDDIKSLSSLKILNMNDNHISKLDCEVFSNTSNLTELYLNENLIVNLEGCVFENLNDLKVLDLSQNRLQTFGGTFKVGVQKLEFLDLSNNFRSVFERGDFQHLQSLKYLNVSSDNIRRLACKVFDGLNNMEALSVTFSNENGNDLKGHSENHSLSFNTDSTFKTRHSNKYEASCTLKSLKIFTVLCKHYQCYLPFKELSEMLQSMIHLEDFRAENVQLTALETDMFQFNRHLKSLTIQNADLFNVKPELFMPIPNLQALDLSQSSLKTLDFLMLANLSALRYLNLGYNEVTVINEEVFQFLPALTFLDLDHNPFTCDCLNAGFIHWVKSNKQTQVGNAHQYACSFPVTEQGKMLLDFDIQACWMGTNFICFISSMCLVLLTLLISFIYSFLRWQITYTFLLFWAFLYDRRHRKKGAPHRYDAFISYNVHDEDWVYQEMLPVLEGEQGWRLCLHHRDFQPGISIIENITDAIYSSRKTICVISHHYLQSEWCSREIQMASFRLFDEKKDVLILLFLEEIPARQLSPYHRMRKLLKKRTYLSWPQAGQHPGVFWQNVRRALETGDARNEDTDPLTGPAGC
ncbi:toll-like receptor 13 [Archocentrus centrarchus]|uniref:toll-like receptor 13 n=1 Tax=Archocentrus centrarchus TaxID=63155 RepID=UPI0011EA4585|nr:toll-like receptor 13 [Archocentrus centrarchus]